MSRAMCPHCGQPLPQAGTAPAAVAPAVAPSDAPPPQRFDLEDLAARALAEKAYDETLKTRVSQDDIRKLVEKRRKRKA